MNKTVLCLGKRQSKTRLIGQNYWRLMSLAFLLLTSFSLWGEGSVNFITYDGNRLFYSANEQQQLKVYAATGEFINVGASHVGITGGYIRVYRPDGTLHTTFDNTGATQGLAIINNDIEEKNGPTGGGVTMGNGYVPGVISVNTGEAGIWTVTLEFPNPTILIFDNLLNSDTWTREEDQPTIQRGVLAWDITVSQNSAGNQGGNLLTGRVFSNEYISVVSRNGNMTSPKYHLLTKDGFMYKVEFMDTDPWNFPFFSNSLGIVDSEGMPTYRSFQQQNYTRSDSPADWTVGDFYLYEPQAEDEGMFINNKIFFSPPNPDLPATAVTTDIFRNNTYSTWLLNPVVDPSIAIQEAIFTGQNVVDNPCPPDEPTAEIAHLIFETNLGGTGIIRLDLNQDGDYDDPIDRRFIQMVALGTDTITWDGLDGLGNPVMIEDGFVLNYDVEVRGGEIHILMLDIENNPGGVSINLLNSPNGTGDNNDQFYYNHSSIATISDISGGTLDFLLPTSIPYTYVNDFGNQKILDYWTFVNYGDNGSTVFYIEDYDDCTFVELDNDNDGISNLEDLDDDNDGIPDRLEFCTQLNSFDCLPADLDPSGDEDGDGIENFQDADDPVLNLNCNDNDGDGICDHLPFQYDIDGDDVPNHYDLDSDNDGITDLVEAGHSQADADGNGIIDGEPADFGLNGFYNPLASDADALTAVANYTPRDKDGDMLPDHHDLDSDNDGINDVAEAGFGQFDFNNNGRLSSSNSINSNGLANLINPNNTGLPIPLPPDSDGDSLANWLDLDSDNDGINDVAEGGKVDGDGDGIIGTGILQINPNGQAILDANIMPLSTSSQPISTDGDLLPDYLDLDSDNDGLNDVAEAGHTDEDNDGIIGNGLPNINANGQANMGNILSISNPKDKDGDELADYRDLDSDNDGLNDVEETGNGAMDADNDGIIGIGQPIVNAQGQATTDASGAALSVTSQTRDSDNDLVADYNDLDSDNDGIHDVEEAGFTGADSDNDGIIGTATPTVNAQGQVNMIINGETITSTSEAVQTDFDLVPDYLDLDSDNDGINDVAEAGHNDEDNDGIIGNGQPTVNTNGQASMDSFLTISNPKDQDGDGLANYRDLDSDNDAINDVAEAGQPDPDGDGRLGFGTPVVNPQGQTIADALDIPQSPISNVPDTDSDGVADYNDLDSDNDAIHDVVEGGNSDEDNDGIVGSGAPFVNAQGQPLISGNGDLIVTTSNPTDTDEDGTPDYQDLDSDDDGISDVVEGGYLDPDNNGMVGVGIPLVNEHGQALGENAPTSQPTTTDEDGTPDYQDLDSDDDGILDMFECPNDAPCADGDNDGIFDFQDIDRDNDGIEDAYECETGAPCVDTDQDGIPDVDDLDSDNDTITDAEECPNGTPCPDSDLNGTDDFREINCVESGLPQIINLMGAGTHCEGDELVLSATNDIPLEGDIQFTWTGPGDFQFTGTAASEGPFMITIPNVDNSHEGAYILTLQSAAGCPSAPQSIIVTINEQPTTPVLTAENLTLCAGSMIELNTTAYTGDVVYNWYYNEVNNPNTTLIDITTTPTLLLNDATVFNSGTYSVVVTVDGCDSNLSNEEFITVFGTGEPVNTSNTSSPTQPACVGETIGLTASPLIEGTTYQWIGPGGFSSTDPSPNIPNVGPEQAGEYMVFVSQNGCPPIPSFSTMVYVQNTVQPMIGGGGLLCKGESVSLEVTNDLEISAGSTVTYQWFEAATNTVVATTDEPSLTLQDISNTEAGDYYLRLTVNGCAAENSNLINISLVDEPAEEAIIVPQELNVCSDQEMTIEAIAPNTAIGTWSTLSNATIINPNEATTTIFDLTEGDNTFIWTLSTELCGDYSSDTLNVILGEAFIDAKIDVVELGFEATLNDYDLIANDDLSGVPDGYIFSIVEAPVRGELISDENGVITYIPQETFTGTIEFRYQICSAICPDDCDETTVKITVNQQEFSGECFVPNAFTPNEDGMNDSFSIDCLETLHSNNKIMVFNRWGDKVFEKENYQNDWKGTYNNQDLPPGTYFYVLKLDKNEEAALQGYMSLVR